MPKPADYAPRNTHTSSPVDDAALSLILRVLGPANIKPGDDVRLLDILPPLTSSNEVDFELYVILAIIINTNISPWYSKITSDPAFVSEVVQIIAHCSRALEQRVRQVSLSALLFDDLAGLLESHIKTWRAVQQAVGRQAEDDVHKVHVAYHALRPHPALNPIPDVRIPQTLIQQQRNDTDYRRLVAEGMLAILLPVEDLQNPCLLSLVSELFADLILGTLLTDRLANGAFLYDCISRAAAEARLQSGSLPWLVDTENAPKDRLKAYGLLSTSQLEDTAPKSIQKAMISLFWTLAQTMYTIVLAIQTATKTFSSATPQERAHYEPIALASTASTKGASLHERKANEQVQAQPHAPAPSASVTRKPQSMLTLRCWGLVGALLWLDIRMPWLSAIAMSIQQLLLQGPGQLGRYDGRLDR